MIDWIDQTDPTAEPRFVLGKPAIPISTKPANLPQTAGWYVWFEVDSPHSSMIDLVHIAKTIDYKPQHLAEIREMEKGPFFYFNEQGEELVICWEYREGERYCPSFYNGYPDADWAPFNFPETAVCRPIIPRAALPAVLPDKPT